MTLPTGLDLSLAAIQLTASPCALPAVVCVPVVLSVLNIFWFYKIVQGAYKVLFGKKKEVKAE